MRRFLGKEYLCKVNWYLFIKLNFFTKSVIRKNGSYIVPYRGTRVRIDHTAKLYLEGDLIFNFSLLRGGESYLLLSPGAKLKIMSFFKIYYNCDIAVFKNALMIIGGGYMNAGSQLRCSKSISIGKGATIARDVMVLDSDSHHIYDDKHVTDQPVIIGEHVWLGTRVLVLKGVRIGHGAIVAAGSIVTKSVSPRSIAAGIPAKSVRENIEWK